MSTFSEITALALPSLATCTVEPILSMVETAMVGHYLGTESIGALGVCTSVFSFVLRIFVFLESATTVNVARAVADLSVFVMVLMLFLFAFMMVGMQIFGQENEEYVSLFKAFVTLFKMGFLGDFDYEGLENVNQGVRA